MGILRQFELRVRILSVRALIYLAYDLRLRTPSPLETRFRLFVQACLERETLSGSHELAYVGTYPLMAQDFLDVLFGTQTAVRPKDAFGFDGMRRQGLALAPPPPFQLESFLDMSLAPVVRKLNRRGPRIRGVPGPIHSGIE